MLVYQSVILYFVPWDSSPLNHHLGEGGVSGLQRPIQKVFGTVWNTEVTTYILNWSFQWRSQYLIIKWNLGFSRFPVTVSVGVSTKSTQLFINKLRPRVCSPELGEMMICVEVNWDDDKHAINKKTLGKYARWWFQTCFIFTPTWGRFPFWQAFFFNWVGSTTN